MSAPAHCIRASNWRRVSRNTLQGFVRLHLPSGLVLNEVSVHRRGDKRWVGLPARALVERDSTVKRDPNTGKIVYQPIIEISSKARREAFQAQALAAVDCLVGSGEHV